MNINRRSLLKATPSFFLLPAFSDKVLDQKREFVIYTIEIINNGKNVLLKINGLQNNAKIKIEFSCNINSVATGVIETSIEPELIAYYDEDKQRKSLRNTKDCVYHFINSEKISSLLLFESKNAYLFRGVKLVSHGIKIYESL